MIKEGATETGIEIDHRASMEISILELEISSSIIPDHLREDINSSCHVKYYPALAPPPSSRRGPSGPWDYENRPDHFI
ncbi:hypothetical protein EVAR_52898_1 [Eumeta japonica]|uniref:Uncharacterized protein n=1 Tax=Eumeta variegata TaxID=151549 RepID=A0A4C1YW69_EUMVA|nr:hypothetical protein EVAR_52898_1 [Eumeta japonica]